MNVDIDDDACVRMLVDIIFNKQVLNAEVIKACNSSIPICLFTEDLIRSFQEVLRITRLVIRCRWERFFDTFYRRMFACHQMYLMYVMLACTIQHKGNPNIFENFISVCALVKYLCDETLQKTEVDFCNLIPDIIKVFYHCMMKTTFCSQRGFRHLVEYIREHRYLTWKLNEDYFVSTEDHTTLVIAIEDEKLKNEMKRDIVIEIKTDFDNLHESFKASNVMAQVVLSTMSVELATLPSEPDLIARLVAYRKREIEKRDERRRVEAALTSENINIDLPLYSSSNSDSKSYDAKHQENIVQEKNRKHHSSCHQT